MKQKTAVWNKLNPSYKAAEATTNATPLGVSVDNKRACHHTIPRPIGKLEHRGLVDGQMKVRSRAVSNLCIRTIMGLFSKANRDRLGVSALLW